MGKGAVGLIRADMYRLYRPVPGLVTTELKPDRHADEQVVVTMGVLEPEVELRQLRLRYMPRLV